MKQFPVKMNRTIMIGAACWALSVVYFVGQAIVQIGSARPYSLATNYISDLGNTACGPVICSPLHGLMNATFFAVGALHILGAMMTYNAWPLPRLSLLGVGLICLAGAGLCVVALAPENVAPSAHTTGAVIGLISVNLGVIVLGLAVVGKVRWLGVAALVASISGVVGLGLFANSSINALPVGITERLADYPATAMIVVFGAVLLTSAILSREYGQETHKNSPQSL